MDPVTLQVMVGALRAACDEMGVVLVRSAHSANVKERRDASTGLFDAEGQMVMQAEHIPVHLGAMPAAVAAVLDEDHAPGDAWILNDPYRGGTHLPDITVISPVFVGRELAGFSASRAHHADVGGRVPGSMPADSKTLDEEGVVIAPTRLAREGELDRDLLDELTEQMRGPRQREADLRAQLAANRAGARAAGSWPSATASTRCARPCARRSTTRSAAPAPRSRRSRTASAPPATCSRARTATSSCELKATVDGDELTLDFAGSADQYDGNLNCPLAVTMSACYFAVRVLADPDVPPCAGAYRPVTVKAPEGSLLNARPPAAVAGGNVETSSRVADLVLAGVRPRARPGHDEQPHARQRRLRLLRDARRRPGRVRGRRRPERRARGDEQHAQHPGRGARARVPAARGRVLGAARLRAARAAPRRRRRGARGGGARAEMTYSLITERRRHRPQGADGGEPGAAGRNLVNGEEVPPKAAGTLRPGDRLRIETPGGGGHGEA